MSRHKMEVDLYKETRKGQTLLCMFSKPGIYHSGIICQAEQQQLHSGKPRSQSKSTAKVIFTTV